MEKTYKRVPFDIELAKKIQSGEVEGRIVTKNDLQCEIVAWCGTDFFVKRRNHKDYPHWCYPYTKSGCLIDGETNGGTDYDLFIELPEETPKHEFKPFDKVLVRDSIDESWKPQLYDRFTKPLGLDKNLHLCLDGEFHYYCISYEGNEHLVGTTNNPE